MAHGAPTVVTSPLGFRAFPGQPGPVVILGSGGMVPLLGMAELLASSEQGDPVRPSQGGAAVALGWPAPRLPLAPRLLVPWLPSHQPIVTPLQDVARPAPDDQHRCRANRVIISFTPVRLRADCI